MFLFAALNEKLAHYQDRDAIDKIADAFLLAADAHEAQARSSGEPYITHPMAVAGILADMHMDAETIMAAILHDVIEDTDTTREELEAQFGEKVGELVDGVTKLAKIAKHSKAEAQAENFRKMMLAMVEDIRVIIIKMADRLHNMSTLGALRPEKRRRIALETLDIFAPIANRLGMHTFKSAFEDLGFEAMYPMRYRILTECVRRARGNRQKLTEKIQSKIAQRTAQEGVTPDRIYGREKRLFSIFKKMRNKGLPFSEIMDVYAFRIIAKDTRECYILLGAAHDLFTPVPGRFKDYIAIPKANGYQSLHTTLFGPHGVPIEIQIRTQEMEERAERGIAAHWLYKTEGYASSTEIRTHEWLQRLLDMQLRSGNSLEFIENVKVDLFPDDVYIFTPTGEIKELPRGATPIDFAYAIHTDVGNRCIAAKINRRLVPLSQTLKNSQTVEILTSPTAVPNPAWLNFAATGKAKNAIKQFLKAREEDESIALGRKLLNYSLFEFKLKWSELKDADKQSLKDRLRFNSDSELYREIGLGNCASAVIAHQLLEIIQGTAPEIDQEPDALNPLLLNGSEGLQTRYATCCHPIPGDDVRGLMKKGKGMVVHRAECQAIIDADFSRHPNDFVFLNWAEATERSFPVPVVMGLKNQKGAVAEVTQIINELGTDILDMRISEMDAHQGTVHFKLNIENRKHLANVIRKLRGLPLVERIERQV